MREREDSDEHKGISAQWGIARRGARGVVFVEGVSVCDIVEQFGSPLYVYSEQMIREAFDAYASALAELPGLTCVSVKANSNLSLLQLLARSGAGFDVVSGGELARVIRAGGDPERVVFAGVGKSEAEIVDGIHAKILMFNVESEPELQRIDAIASRLGARAPVALRVNPDVGARTHPSISTGLLEHKFGIPLDLAAEIYRNTKRYPSLDFVGVDCHIGSLIADLSVFRAAFEKVKRFALEFRAKLPTLSNVDLGGGLGVSYRREASGERYPSIAQYTAVVREMFQGSGFRVIVEPGRSVFANAGLLLTQVLFVKKTPRKEFVVVDAGFNDLIRPTLYDAYHAIESAVAANGRRVVLVDVVGPICETSDCFAEYRELSEVEPGELLVVFSAGAYGFTMASNYNLRVRPAEVLVSGETARLIRRRETLAELLAPELECLDGEE